MTSQHRRANIYDYPEHLNPFYEGDNHNFIRFKNLKKVVRSNSFSFQSVRDFKNTLSRSFRIKNRRGSKSSNQSEDSTNNDSFERDINKARKPEISSNQELESGVRSDDRIGNRSYKDSCSPRPGYLSNQTTQDANNTNEPIPPPRVHTFPRRKKRAPPPPKSADNEIFPSPPASVHSESVSDITQEQNEIVEDDVENTTTRTLENIVPNMSLTDSDVSLTSAELTNNLEDEDEAADLLEMVQLLQKEVEKLTGDTNNNMLTPNCDNEKPN